MLYHALCDMEDYSGTKAGSYLDTDSLYSFCGNRLNKSVSCRHDTLEYLIRTSSIATMTLRFLPQVTPTVNKLGHRYAHCIIQSEYNL